MGDQKGQCGWETRKAASATVLVKGFGECESLAEGGGGSGMCSLAPPGPESGPEPEPELTPTGSS